MTVDTAVNSGQRITKDSAECKRVYWHSRRGMLELDVILMPFAQNKFPELDSESQARYINLLTQEDQDLFLWLMQRSVPEDAELQQAVEQILDYAQSRDHA